MYNLRTFYILTVSQVFSLIGTFMTGCARARGRVFALLYQMMYVATPISLLLTGPLVDQIMEPAVGGTGWDVVSPIVGSDPGSGMGLLMVISGVVLFITTAIVYAHPKVRSAEAEYPDYKAV